jgi:hypothetical protein
MNERPTHTLHSRGAALFAAVALIATAANSGGLFYSVNRAQLAATNQSTAEPIGFYCNLKAFTPAERARHSQLSHDINQLKVETVELANGFAFRFQDASISLTELAEWVSAERKCCPFFDFEIELQGNNGPLWLKLRGKEGVKAFMRSEFHIH